MNGGEVRIHEVAGATVVVLSGELDVVVAPEVAPQLRELLDDARGVVLDLTHVTFFDSSGVRLVDEVARGCVGRNVRWSVVAPTGGPTRRVLELMGMLGPEVVEDRATALAHVVR